MAALTGVVQLVVEAGEEDVIPGEVVVVVSIGGGCGGVVTVPQYALQLTGYQAVVLIPEAVSSDEGGGSAGGARPPYQVPPVLALPSVRDL